MNVKAFTGVDYGVTDALLQPEGLLPGQLDTSTSWSGEKRLFYAILTCALMDALPGTVDIRLVGREGAVKRFPGGTGNNGGRPEPGIKSRRRIEARAWIESDDPAWAGSFVSVCEGLGLEPDYVRRKVRERWE